MNLFDKYSPLKLFLISLTGAFFIIYPNTTCLFWELGFIEPALHSWHFGFYFFRFLFFIALIWLMLRYNLRDVKTTTIKKRCINNLIFIGIAYLIYMTISFSVKYFLPIKYTDHSNITLICQFGVIWIVCAIVGHIFVLYNLQKLKDQEIERLKIENLQSRCDALTNQINPHFFFNSLNSLAALIRKKDDVNTLAYINTLSDVFRYILQSEKKGLVSLEEELEFVQAFRYMLEVRYANKLIFSIVVAKEQLDLKIPVLSLLPLIDNIITHNTIDSEHKMEVTIRLNDRKELVVTNPVFPKLMPAETNGTGLENLENRFILLMDKSIRIENNGKTFMVYLPLK
jgi:hypothetical protein